MNIVEVKAHIEIDLRMSEREFGIITKALGGVALSGEDKRCAAELNKRMLEQRIKVHRQAADITEGALAKANAAQPQPTELTP